MDSKLILDSSIVILEQKGSIFFTMLFCMAKNCKNMSYKFEMFIILSNNIQSFKKINSI